MEIMVDMEAMKKENLLWKFSEEEIHFAVTKLSEHIDNEIIKLYKGVKENK